eukprot:364705-Chlamydomonas_euryale.AAC.6
MRIDVGFIVGGWPVVGQRSAAVPLKAAFPTLAAIPSPRPPRPGRANVLAHPRDGRSQKTVPFLADLPKEWVGAEPRVRLDIAVVVAVGQRPDEPRLLVTLPTGP